MGNSWVKKKSGFFDDAVDDDDGRWKILFG